MRRAELRHRRRSPCNERPLDAMPNTVKPAFLVTAHVTKVAHVLAFTVFVLVLAWVLHFRGGAARLHSDDPNLIFNVQGSPTLLHIV